MAKPSAASKLIAQLENDKREHQSKIEILDYAIAKLKMAQPFVKPRPARKVKPAAEGSDKA